VPWYQGHRLTSNFDKAQQILKDAGYDETPVVLLHSTDLAVLTNMAPVAESLMEKAGFKVDVQSMDWQTLVARRAKKEPPGTGGWNVFITAAAWSPHGEARGFDRAAWRAPDAPPMTPSTFSTRSKPPPRGSI
jgi:ABC-type transport system substrate-binding protein